MTAFHIYFPETARRETRSVTMRGDRRLLDGEYGFLELYCDEQGCDCRRVLFYVVSSTAVHEILATINYGWETRRCYERWMGNRESARWCRGASLEPFGTQTEYSAALLRLFETVVVDKEYVERLKRHYAMFKDAVEAGRIKGEE
jgi:hypothetical protein